MDHLTSIALSFECELPCIPCVYARGKQKIQEKFVICCGLTFSENSNTVIKPHECDFWGSRNTLVMVFGLETPLDHGRGGFQEANYNVRILKWFWRGIFAQISQFEFGVCTLEVTDLGHGINKKCSWHYRGLAQKKKKEQEVGKSMCAAYKNRLWMKCANWEKNPLNSEFCISQRLLPRVSFTVHKPSYWSH
jgi:hypothetical protein